jgi:hypothetical protein
MAIKIICEGAKKKRRKVYKGHCFACGCIFEAEVEDITLSSPRSYVQCPTEGCEENVDVVEKQFR